MEIKRRKLFSSPTENTKPTRRKLFSTASNLNSKDRIKLFSDKAVDNSASERMFSEVPESEFGTLLQTWQGKEMNSDYATKIFSGVDLVSEGLAENIGEGKIKVFSMAGEMEKMFSSLKVTVIKELCLDPVPSIAPVIESLGVEKGLPTKTVVLLKKAHNLPKESIYSETETWIKDSGIAHDLKEEFGGRDFTKEELNKVLEERYDDAPEEIIDCLKNSGVIENTPEGDLRIKEINNI